MAALELMEEELRDRFPDAKISLDLASAATGASYLDVDAAGHRVIIQWKAGNGFGISCARENYYGEGADEVYQDEEAAYARVLSLLLSRTHTSPPESVRIAELRRQRGFSQESLALRLNVRQAAVSKLEHRKDVLVSSVREVVRSMGGELYMIAKFPDGLERTLEIDETAEHGGKKAHDDKSE